MATAAFAQLLKEMIGLDAESIGTSALERAVNERRIACRADDLAAYWEYVQASDTERQLLVEEVIVPETWFFRDRGAFDALARLTEQAWQSRPDRTLRILSVPCSSGEEPYSIAMTLREAAVAPRQVHIDAVDVSARMLAHARRAVYGRNSFRGAGQTFRDRYFEATPGGFRLADGIRSAVQFQHGNLLGSTFLASAEPYDVIFCRNLLIYFDRPTQDRAIRTLARLLAPGGFLFVGASETGVLLNHDFVSLQQPMAFAYRLKTDADRQPAPMAAPLGRPRPLVVAPPQTVAATVTARPVREPRRESPRPVARQSAIDEAYRLADQGHFAEAATACEEQLRRDGPSARAFYLLGLVRDASGNAADAESMYRKALYLDPEHRETLLHLALLMDRHGRQAEARVLKNRVRRLADAGEASEP